MKSKQLSRTFRDYITVREAAGLLGVSVATVRNWDRAGKLTATRHPINGYRLYLRSQISLLLAAVNKEYSNKEGIRNI